MMLHRHFDETKDLESHDTTNPTDPLYIPPKKENEVDIEDAGIYEADDELPKRNRTKKSGQ